MTGGTESGRKRHGMACRSSDLSKRFGTTLLVDNVANNSEASPLEKSARPSCYSGCLKRYKTIIQRLHDS